MPLAPGFKLGPYEILGPLGTGGMGEVYRARDTRLARDVAIKIIPESLARDPDRLRRFEQEARAVAALNHPNILAIHDIGEQAGIPYLVSELLEGQTLRAQLDSGPLSARKSTEYAIQVAQGLAAAHEKNIIHRDLKPDNIFLTREGRAKILDFGLAKLAANDSTPNSDAAFRTLTSLPTEAGVVMGTVGYMAPEQVRGAAVDPRTDIFAFGAVLYEMVSGKRAFQRDSAVETMTAILKEDPPDLNEALHPVPQGLERIIRRCLEKQPDQRFQSAKDLAFALEAVTGATTSKTLAANVAAADSAAAAQAIKSPTANWKWILAGLLAGIALTSAIAFLLRPKPRAVPTFTRLTFDQATVIRGRLTSDGATVVYSALLANGAPETYFIRDEYPEAVPAGLSGALLLSLSRQGQLALLTKPQYFAHYHFIGTLAVAPMGGGAPREILENVMDADWTPDGKEMAVILADAKNHKFRLQFPIGKTLWEGNNWISDLRISPDGQSVAFFRHPPNTDDRGDLLLIDRSGKSRLLEQDWASLESLSWSPDGKEVWFAGAEISTDYCIRAVSLSGVHRAIYCGSNDTRIHDIASTGRALISADQSRIGMMLIDHSTKSERDMTWLDNDYNPRLSRDGSVMLFTDQSVHAGKTYSTYIRKTDGSSAVRIGGGGYATDLSPDGKWALVVLGDDPQGRVQVIPVGPGEPKVLHWDNFHPQWAFWYPDGQHIGVIALQGDQPQKTYVTDISGATPQPLPGEPVFNGHISPDATRLFTRKDNVWLTQPLPDGTATPIPGLRDNEFPIAWSADGKSIFAETRSPNGLSVAKIDLATGKREDWMQWSPKSQVGLAPWKAPISITPDGRYMAFTYGTHFGQFYRSDTLR